MKGILYIIILLSALPVFSVRAQVVPPGPAQPGSQTGQQIGTPGGPQNKQQTPSQIGYGDVRITRSGEYVDVSFEVMAGRKSVKRGEQLILTPVLFNDVHKVPLPTIAIQSRRAELQAFRAGKRSASPHTPAYATRNGGKIQYSTRIPYTETLTDLFLGIERKAQRCGRASSMSAIMLTDHAALVPVPPALYIPEVRPLSAYAFSLPVTSVADSLSRHYPFVASMEEFERSKRTPNNKLFDPNMSLNMGKGQSESEQGAVELFVLNNEKGAMQINFERASTRILRYYKDNNLSLVTLASVLKEIQSSENSHVAKVVIAGFASPEGPLERNDRLAWGRAESTLDFVRNNSTVGLTRIQLYNGSEDWRGLRRMILSSQIEHKEQLLDIIDRVPVLSGREGQLMQVAGGRPYRYMAEHFFPELRNAAYIKVYYDTPPAVAAAAQDIQSAWERMHSGDYTGALELLNAQGVLPGGGTENLMGVCCIMLGDYDRAREYLGQAVAKGNAEAGENLKRITEEQ